MEKVRNILGLIGGLLLILSGFAHSLAGWKQLKVDLAKAQIPPDLTFGLKVGWHFGGVSMLVLGVITTMLFAKRLRGTDASTFPAIVIAVSYLCFGAWALLASSFNPFYLAFIVPGILLVMAGWSRSSSS
jgi:hypothetical protein